MHIGVSSNDSMIGNTSNNDNIRGNIGNNDNIRGIIYVILVVHLGVIQVITIS